MENKDLKIFADELKKRGVKMSEEEARSLVSQLEKDFLYVPKIGVFGKTGAGKSSFVNAVFGKKVCPVSDVEACTRGMMEQNVGGIILVDCPGIAESKERDIEYKKLYTDLIPDLDAIIWVLKGDDRSYGPDIEFFDTIRDSFKQKDGKNITIFFALNQVDKIEPFFEWDRQKHEPGLQQGANIQAKVRYVASQFKVSQNIVIPVSANEKYNLPGLLSSILYALPANKAIIVANNSDKDVINNNQVKDVYIEKVKEYKKSWPAKVGEGLDIAGDFVSKFLPATPVGWVLKGIGKLFKLFG